MNNSLASSFSWPPPVHFGTCAELVSLVFDHPTNSLYSSAMHSMGVLNTLATLLSAWALIRHTPPEMAVYRWYLLNVALSVYALDVWDSVFYLPVWHVPSSCPELQVSASLGILAMFGKNGAFIGFLVFIQLIGSCGIAALGAFAYRYAAMCGKLDWLKRRRVLVGMALVQLFYSTPCALIRALLQKTAWNEECCESCRWTISATTVPFLHVLTCTSFSAIIVAALVLIYATSRSLAKLRAKMSIDTYKYQRQLIVSLVLQFVIPFSLMGLSYGLLLILLYNVPASGPVLSRTSFLITSSHTTLNTAVMLGTVKPYREAVIAKLAQILTKFGINKNKMRLIRVGPIGIDQNNYRSHPLPDIVS